jgi:hypothetical protein
MKKHLVPFNKLMFETTVIGLLLDAIMSHQKIFFEAMESGLGYFKFFVNLMNLRDT